MIDTNSKTTTYTQTDAAKNKKQGCCPPAEHEAHGGCCELVCFERPHYFCGHLLTDADLSAEQRYVIEKNKLYHRALDGQGVVCGLRLTCDHTCPGRIMIGEGFAIDDCGNDLVVCTSTPFDVIDALRKKDCLIDTAVPDPCKPISEQPECDVRQCFYVTICYNEEPAEFTTPFVAGCRPKLSECEHTRVRETFRFDVVSELPKAFDWRSDLDERIEKCRRLFTDSPFAKALSEGGKLLLASVSGNAPVEEHKNLFDLFCKLRGLLRLHLKKYPDKYNCTIEDDIEYIPFPPEPERRLVQNYNQEIRVAFCRLLELANQYVQACIHGEMILSCPEPCETSCVVLGTVEVARGKVVRVCNTPRSFVSPLGPLYKGLIASVLSGIGRYRQEPGAMAPKDESCCPDFELNCELFVSQFVRNPKAAYEASLALPHLFTDLDYSIKRAFDFTRTDIVSPRSFEGMTIEEATKIAEEHKTPLTIKEQPAGLSTLEPLDVIQSYFLRPAQPMVAFRSGGQVVNVKPDLSRTVPLDPAEREALEAGVKIANENAAAATAGFNQIREELAKKEQELQVLKTRLDSVASNVEGGTRSVNAKLDEVASMVRTSDAQIADITRNVGAASSTSAAELKTFEARLAEIEAAANARVLTVQNEFKEQLKAVVDTHTNDLAELRKAISARKKRPAGGGTPPPAPAQPPQ